jgi:hypothetical protein
MSTHVIEIPKADINLEKAPTVTISLPDKYRDRDPRGRKGIERALNAADKDKAKLKEQIDEIVREREGSLGPLRSYGAGVLPLVWWPGLPETKGEKNYYAVVHIRGSNRGSVWAPGGELDDVFCWKEFAGVTGLSARI